MDLVSGKETELKVFKSKNCIFGSHGSPDFETLLKVHLRS